MAMTQAIDFKDESEALYNLVAGLDDAAFRQPTQFKGWTLNDVFEHLHLWNWAANESLVDEAAFMAFLDDIRASTDGGGLKPYERQWIERHCDGAQGRDLVALWRQFYTQMGERFAAVDPKMRLKWAGPDMSARSSITARLMETWAHGQEVYDSLSVVRQNADRIQNIVVLGINTFGWTYAARGVQPPGQMPLLKLTAPSGALWEYGEPSDSGSIEGAAEEFCQVVTQVRNIADTALRVSGEVALDWMSKAQCFAGAAETPPPAGTRFTA